MDESLLRLQSVMDRTGMKRSKLYALALEGKFPRPIKVEGCAVWPKTVIDRWIAEKLATHNVGA